MYRFYVFEINIKSGYPDRRKIPAETTLFRHLQNRGAIAARSVIINFSPCKVIVPDDFTNLPNSVFRRYRHALCPNRAGNAQNFALVQIKGDIAKWKAGAARSGYVPPESRRPAYFLYPKALETRERPTTSSQ